MKRIVFFLVLLYALPAYALEKNVASQQWVIFCFSETDGTVKTGDALNITANLRIDGAAANAVDDVNPDELEDGYYKFNITATESNGNNIVIAPASSTANIQCKGEPSAVWTRPANWNDFSVTATTGRVDVASIGGTAQTANDNGAAINTILSRIIGTLAAGTHNPQGGDAYTRIGAAGAGLTAIPWNVAWDPEVESEATDALTAYDPPTKAEMDLRTLPTASYFDPATDAVAVISDHSGFQKNESRSITFPMVDETDGKTLETGLQATLRTAGNSQSSCDGAAFADLTNIATVAHMGTGVYRATLTATELNCSDTTLKFMATGTALTRIISINTSD